MPETHFYFEKARSKQDQNRISLLFYFTILLRVFARQGLTTNIFLPLKQFINQSITIDGSLLIKFIVVIVLCLVRKNSSSLYVLSTKRETNKYHFVVFDMARSPMT